MFNLANAFLLWNSYVDLSFLVMRDQLTPLSASSLAILLYSFINIPSALNIRDSIIAIACISI